MGNISLDCHWADLCWSVSEFSICGAAVRADYIFTTSFSSRLIRPTHDPLSRESPAAATKMLLCASFGFGRSAETCLVLLLEEHHPSGFWKVSGATPAMWSTAKREALFASPDSFFKVHQNVKQVHEFPKTFSSILFLVNFKLSFRSRSTTSSGGSFSLSRGDDGRAH